MSPMLVFVSMLQFVLEGKSTLCYLGLICHEFFLQGSASTAGDQCTGRVSQAQGASNEGQDGEPSMFV